MKNVGKKTIIQLLKNSSNVKIEEVDEIFEYTIQNNIEIDSINIYDKDFDIFKFEANIKDIQQQMSQQLEYNQFAENHSNLIYLVVMDGKDESCDALKKIFDEFAQLFDQNQLKDSHQSFVALIITKCETNYQKKYQEIGKRNYSYYNELLRDRQSTVFPNVDQEKEGKNLQQLSIDIKNILYNIYQKQVFQKFKLQKVSYMGMSVRKNFQSQINNMIILFTIFLENLKIEVFEYFYFNPNQLQDCISILNDLDQVNQHYTFSSQQFQTFLKDIQDNLQKYNRELQYFHISLFQLKKIEELLRNFENFYKNIQLNSFTFDVELNILTNFLQQFKYNFQQFQKAYNRFNKTIDYSKYSLAAIGAFGLYNLGITASAFIPIYPLHLYQQQHNKKKEEQLQHEIQKYFEML